MKIVFTVLLGWVLCLSIPAAFSAWRPKVEPFELEQHLHSLINQYRLRQGLNAFRWNDHLAAIARNHSQDMAQGRYFSHYNMQGESPSDRARRQGWNWQKRLDATTVAVGIAENLFMQPLYEKMNVTRQNGMIVGQSYDWLDTDQLAEAVVQGWLDSPPHRKNLFSPDYDNQGIGVAIEDGEVYVTENLF